ncbi:MAG: hypothetical protein WD738_08715 [Pirellulales bacterium]
MRDETFSDDILFDRLVDGELPDAERRRLLTALDERPDGWRRCALAFLESQSWSSDIRQLVREPASTPINNDPVTRAAALRKPLRRGMAWLAIAASLLVAFTFGRLQRDAGNSIATLPPNADEQLAVVTPPEQRVPEPARADDALTLWVRDDAGQTRPLRVPLVDAAALDRQLGVQFQSGMPAAVRERLQKRGYDVQSKRRYAPLWLENGRPMIVPVEDMKIVPVGQNVY